MEHSRKVIVACVKNEVVLPGGGTLNVEVIGMLIGNFFLENPKKYPNFDFKPLKNTQIAIFRAVLGKIVSIFKKFSRRP